MIRLFPFIVSLLFALAPFAAADDHGLLNEEERQWLDSLDGPLIVGSEANYRPYSYVDEQGQLDGIAADYLRLLGDKLGLDFVVREYPSFADTLDAARKRHIDIVPFAIAAPERKVYLEFTQPFFETRDRILTSVEITATLTLDDLGGMRVGLVEGYALQADIEVNRPEINLVPMPNELDGLRALSLGDLDALIVDVGVASYHIQNESISNLRVSGEVPVVGQQTFGTRSDWPLLNSIIGKGLANISDEQHEEIGRRWINIRGVDPGELSRLWQQIGVVVGVVFLVLVAMFLWSLSLRRQVSKRTAELQVELAERRRVEAAKDRLAVAVEQSAEYVLVIDTDGLVEYANLSFLEAHGDTGLEGQSLDSLFSAEKGGALSRALESVRERGVWRGQVDFSAESGETTKVAMTISPIHDDLAEIDGYVASGRDVTREEKLEARLRQGEKLSALGTLAGGIAHDFNNLLMPILGYTDLIRMDASPKVTSYLGSIAEAGERARDLVDRILSFGRGGKGVSEPLDIAFEIEEAVTFLRSLLPTTIDVQSEVRECSAVLGDRTEIQQILLNLCTNASDAMAEGGGILKISLEQVTIQDRKDSNHLVQPELTPGDYALLTISDTGVGMDDQTRARIFDPYYSDKLREKGTGLGLATVHGIVSKYGGFIHVESAPGEGAAFEVYLPNVDAAPKRHPADSSKGTPRGHGEHLMVIDDDELVLGTVKAMVESLNYEVSAWPDAVAALEAFAETPDKFAAILADFTMPGLTGIQVAEEAWKVRPDLPIIIMTGNVGALQGYEIKSVGKPIPLGELARLLREALGQ